MKAEILAFLMAISLATSQFANPQKNIAHKAVVQTAAQEAQLPPALRNPHYQNPILRPLLAKNSWFGPGERQVRDRETEKIPRKSIFNVLNHAGLLPQQQLL